MADIWNGESLDEYFSRLRKDRDGNQDGNETHIPEEA